MITSLYGEIAEISLDGLISIDLGSIGYEVFVPRPSDFHLGEKTKVFTVEILTQDDHYLVGFLTKEEKKAFESLHSVKGIGPKTALSALSKTTPSELFSAIESGNAKYLKSLPGIGPKAASQIILDLKGKLVETEAQVASTKINVYETVVAALKGLGFKATDIKEAVGSLPEGMSDQDALKMALRSLGKRK